MPVSRAEQILHVGVDVGGTFTDLVAWDGKDLRVVKVPSTPPRFHDGVIDAVGRVWDGSARVSIVHGSTVATNALLQRRGGQVAFITTEGFRDMLLIGRQNRPKLYALQVERPRPITSSENFFPVRERLDARGNILTSLDDAEIERVVAEIVARGLKHAAVCLLFSFVNPGHERKLGRALENAGISVSLSCEIMPEFREYERASTTTINAALRPTVRDYLEALQAGLKTPRAGLRIMHSGGGTISISEAERFAARLVLSGPAGGVIGAAHVASHAGYADIITFDMGGTSTDVATVNGGKPQWTTGTTIDGLPIGLPMFHIHTIGAGGGSIAYVDTGGALRVGPQSAGAVPGPACYGRGGDEPTVTDANVVLGRIIPDQFLGGAMTIDVAAAKRVIDRLAGQMSKSPVEAALGVVRVVESNMAHAVRAVTSRRGLDPRDFALVSFGGAGGLHACGIAESLDIPLVVVPPYAGVLSALGMVVAPPVFDVSQAVLAEGNGLDDRALQRQIAELRQRLGTPAESDTIEHFADVRFKGQSHELTVGFDPIDLGTIEARFREAYRGQYGHADARRTIEVVALRLRRTGAGPRLSLPPGAPASAAWDRIVELIDDDARPTDARATSRGTMPGRPPLPGPALILDPDATTFIPQGWAATLQSGGIVLLSRRSVSQTA